MCSSASPSSSSSRSSGKRVNVWRTTPWFMPMAALLTIWWTNGFSILLFLAGLRNIPRELYEAAALDGATRWQVFRSITWPLIWPVTALCLTIQLILQLKIFDQVYLFAQGGRTRPRWCWCSTSTSRRFQKIAAASPATIAVALFVIVVVFSVLQYQVLGSRRREMTDPHRFNGVRRLPGRRPFLRPGGLDPDLLTVAFAAIWFFPVYWALAPASRPTTRRFAPASTCCPDLHLDGYAFVIQNSQLPIWYVNSIITSVAVTVISVAMAARRLRDLAAAVPRPDDCSGTWSWPASWCRSRR
jgi:ABC-type glycerol-3-phosphate transport system permease component